MKKINEYTYRKILRLNPLLVTRTKNGFYLLKSRKEVISKKEKKGGQWKKYNTHKNKGGMKC